MPSVHSILRERLLKSAGLIEPKKSKFTAKDLKRLEETEWSSEFEKLMRNRLLMGALRYGTFAEKAVISKGSNPWDLIGAVTKKIKLYTETGNTEYLVDAANYLLLAFEFDPHPNKHFYALDDHSDHCQRRSDVTKKT